MENVKVAKAEKKGFNWDAVANFGAELVKLTIVAGLTAYVGESVRNSMSRRKDESNVLDFGSARKTA